MSDLAIDRRSPIPFYVQLKEAIVDLIATGGYEPGDRLPGEMELCEQYDVSRTVVRQALLELELEGHIRREKGRGTFVADRHSTRGIGGTLVGAFEDIQSGGGEQRSRVLRRGIIPASSGVARDLGVDEGEDVVEIERLREIDGTPWAFTRTQLPLDIGRPLLDVALEDVSLFGILEREFGVRFDRARRAVEADIAHEPIASLLGVAPGAPLLVMHSISFDDSGRPIERFTGHHRGDRGRLEIEVRNGSLLSS